MRFKVTALILVAGLLAVGALFLLKQGTAKTTSNTDALEDASGVMLPVGNSGTGETKPANLSNSQPAAAVPLSEAMAVIAADAKFKAASMTSAIATNASPEAKQAYVRATIRKLENLGAENDSQSLNQILPDLTNSMRTIRDAAREAAVQFGSRDAIPKLREAVNAVEDPREKVALLDAIEFLELPTLSEKPPATGEKPAAATRRPPSHPVRPPRQGQPPTSANPTPQ